VSDADLVRLLHALADQPRLGDLAGGLLRQAARRIIELTTETRYRDATIRDLRAHAADLAGTPAMPCPTCGGPVTQPETGRPRKYCSTRCRSRARNRA